MGRRVPSVHVSAGCEGRAQRSGRGHGAGRQPDLPLTVITATFLICRRTLSGLAGPDRLLRSDTAGRGLRPLASWSHRSVWPQGASAPKPGSEREVLRREVRALAAPLRAACREGSALFRSQVPGHCHQARVWVCGALLSQAVTGRCDQAFCGGLLQLAGQTADENTGLIDQICVVERTR